MGFTGVEEGLLTVETKNRPMRAVLLMFIAIDTKNFLIHIPMVMGQGYFESEGERSIVFPTLRSSPWEL